MHNLLPSFYSHYTCGKFFCLRGLFFRQLLQVRPGTPWFSQRRKFGECCMGCNNKTEFLHCRQNLSDVAAYAVSSGSVSDTGKNDMNIVYCSIFVCLLFVVYSTAVTGYLMLWRIKIIIIRTIVWDRLSTQPWRARAIWKFWRRSTNVFDWWAGIWDR